jgi:ankyrin repeat protein
MKEAPTPSATMNPQQTNDPILIARMIQAAEAGDNTTVRQFLAQGADINAQDDRGRTPLMAATHGNHVETVRVLIEAGADINIRDNRSDNPFLYAGAEGLLDILKLTIDAGADTRLTNRFGGTALIPAAERGHVEVVQELLNRTDVEVNHINNLGWTALLEAIILGDGGERHQQIVRLLVDHGANIMIADKDGVTPLEHARARDFRAIEQILLEAARVRDMGMSAAAEAGEADAVKVWLSQGASVHAQDKFGVTALIAAAYRNDLEIVDILIDAGADVNLKDHTQQSTYLIATSEGYLELLLKALQAGADVHSKDSYNGTGLIRAAERGHVEIIRELLKMDIPIDHVNRLGWTALLEAIILGEGGERHTEVVRLLVEAGADVNLADSNGVTPLKHAQQRGFKNIEQILITAGAR